MKSWFTRKKVHARKKRKKAQGERSVLRAQIFVGFALMLIIAALIAIIYFGTRSSAMQITVVTAIGGNTIAHAQVEEIVLEQLSGSYLRLVPRTFTWTYPERSILRVLHEVPRLKQAELVLEGQVLTVAFDEYRPVALWCDDEESCYFLDHTALAFATAPELTGGAFIRYSEQGREFELKTAMVPRELFEASQDFAERLASVLDLYVTHVHMVDDLDVAYTVSGGGVIKVSREMDVDTTFSNLQSILQSEQFMHLESGDFAYVDLRFGDKIFVNEVGESAHASSTEEEE